MMRGLVLVAIAACGGSHARVAEVRLGPPLSYDAGATSDDAAPPPPAPYLRDVLQLSVGSAHVCALTAAHDVVCWGDNATGELGVGANNRYVGKSSPHPHVVGRLPPIASLAAGKMHTCAIDTKGAVYCWGSAGGDYKETGGGASGSIELTGVKLGTPVKMPLGEGEARHVAVSRMTNAACAAFDDDVRCWSTNRAIPIDARHVTTLPGLRTTSLPNVSALAMSHGKVCAIANQRLSCWHDGDAPMAAQWGAGKTFAPVAVAMGEMYACALSAAGEARCWWSLIDDFWKKPPNRDVTWPGKIPTHALAVGDSPICTADTAGHVDCFLSEETGLTDDAVAVSWATRALGPHPVAGVEGAIDVGLGTGRNVFGYGFGCALLEKVDARGAQVVCWGDNDSGQLGTGDTVATKSAAPVVSPLP